MAAILIEAVVNSGAAAQWGERYDSITWLKHMLDLSTHSNVTTFTIAGHSIRHCE